MNQMSDSVVSTADQSPASEEPIRTCIATKIRKPQSQLLRVVLDPSDRSTLVADPRRRAAGRGAWITPTLDALELALKRHAFQRALKVSTPVDAGHVRKYLEAITAPRPDR